LVTTLAAALVVEAVWGSATASVIAVAVVVLFCTGGAMLGERRRS